MPLYRLVRAVLRAAMNVFFREIHLVGLEHVPPEGAGPVLFAGNHPNSLIDPVLVVVTSGRIVHFAAKDKLFTFPMGLVLAALGAVPIARAMDAKDDAKRDNSGALQALRQVLRDGRSTGIFPEGLSHDKAQLQRIRSGAARIALGTAAAHPEAGLIIVPVGLTYMHRKSFRSQVLVQYGPPIDVDADWVEHWNRDERGAAGELTTDIESAMRALTVNAPDWETLRVLDGVRRLYQPKNVAMADRVELARRFCIGYEQHAEHPKIIELVAKMRIYLDDLDDLGLDDRDLITGLRPGRALASILRLMFFLPIAIPGLPVLGPLYVAIDLAGRRFSPRNDVVGTSRVVFGLLAAFGAYFLLPAIVAIAIGPVQGLVTLAVLLASGFASLVVLERSGTLLRLWTRAVAAFTLGDHVKALKARRDALELEVVGLVNEFKPADLELLFPRDVPPPRQTL